MNTEENLRPDAICDGGDLDCGSGLLLIIAMQPLPPGGCWRFVAVRSA